MPTPAETLIAALPRLTPPLVGQQHLLLTEWLSWAAGAMGHYDDPTAPQVDDLDPALLAAFRFGQDAIRLHGCTRPGDPDYLAWTRECPGEATNAAVDCLGKVWEFDQQGWTLLIDWIRVTADGMADHPEAELDAVQGAALAFATATEER